jgi:hypothetical protein
MVLVRSFLFLFLAPVLIFPGKIKNNNTLTMEYVNYDVAIREGKSVELAGWPADVKIEKRAEWSVETGRRIRDMLRTGAIHWVMTKTQHDAFVAEQNAKREELGAGSLRKRKPRNDKGKPRGPRKGKGKTVAANVDSEEDDGEADSDNEADQDYVRNEGEKEIQPTPHAAYAALAPGAGSAIFTTPIFTPQVIPSPFDFSAYPELQTLPEYNNGLGAYPGLPPVPTYNAGLELLQLLQAGMEEIAPSNGSSMGHDVYGVPGVPTSQLTLTLPGTASNATPAHSAGPLTTAPANADPLAGGLKRKRASKPNGSNDAPPAKKPRKKRSDAHKDTENAPAEATAPEKKVRKKRSDAGKIKGPRQSK